MRAEDRRACRSSVRTYPLGMVVWCPPSRDREGHALAAAAVEPDHGVNDRVSQMDLETARSLARRVHAGQLTRSGELVIDHVERVANSVPKRARALAYLHDVLERSGMTLAVLREQGLTGPECSVLELITRRPRESYRAYVMRIARAPGRAGRLARLIKLADLDDHLRARGTHPAPDFARGRQQTAPDYAWGRQQIASAQSGGREWRGRAGTVQPKVRTTA